MRRMFSERRPLVSLPTPLNLLPLYRGLTSANGEILLPDDSPLATPLN
jgi:hypothetical protein